MRNQEDISGDRLRPIGGALMANRTEKRYLVILSLKDATVPHLAEVIPRIQQTLARLATESPQQAFRTRHGDTVGYLLRSRSHAREIATRLQTPAKQPLGLRITQAEMPFLTNADAIFVIELGEDFHATAGFTRAGTWLQHH
jgi:hypothetical protein